MQDADVGGEERGKASGSISEPSWELWLI